MYTNTISSKLVVSAGHFRVFLKKHFLNGLHGPVRTVRRIHLVHFHPSMHGGRWLSPPRAAGATTTAIRTLALRCSASDSDCGRSWSIEGWIQSKKRNRLGQRIVERLVRLHTNIALQRVLTDWREETLPWEVEMMIKDPASSDESE